MKADFEKGTKVCSTCKRELPIEMFHKDRTHSDSLKSCCKMCSKKINASSYNKNRKKYLKTLKEYADKNTNTFGRKAGRGCNSSLKRDYELTKEQLERRNKSRLKRKPKTIQTNMYGVLIWYDMTLGNITSKEYEKILKREYDLQKHCAIRGYIARKNPSEHFLFDFDLEQMLKGNVYISGTKGRRRYITKWWDGEIRHWTVNDGIWKK